MEEKMKQQDVNEEAEVSDDDLEQVAGGAGLRQTVKVKTVDITEETKRNI